MDIVKKNLLSFIFAGIALIALIALVFPTGGWFSDLESRMQARGRVFTEMRGLLLKPRFAPTIALENTESVPLDGFPSKTFIEKGREVTTRVEEQSQQMYRAAVQMNRRQLLVENVLPLSGDTAKFRFREQYRRAMTETLPYTILRGGVPPTAEEIEQRKARLWHDEFRTSIKVYAGGQTNEAQVTEAFNAAAAQLPMLMTAEVAQKQLIYVDPNAFTIQQGIEGSQAPNPENIWWAQQGLWIQQDVAEAIAATNSQATNVLNAPVKRLVALQVPSNYVFPAAAMPASGSPDSAQPVSTEPSVSPTGHVSNSVYDVVHFKLEVVIDANEIPTLLRELSRQRLITVTRVEQLASVDSSVDESMGFIYGDQPVVKLSLNCEALLLREWTVPLMPQTILQRLGITPTPAVSAMR